MKEKLNDYVQYIKDICELRKWTKDWKAGGCYIHLEASEFIEALRGKRGDPHDELGDLLFTILAVADYYDLDPTVALYDNIVKHCNSLLADALDYDKLIEGFDSVKSDEDN